MFLGEGILCVSVCSGIVVVVLLINGVNKDQSIVLIITAILFFMFCFLIFSVICHLLFANHNLHGRHFVDVHLRARI